MLKRTIKYTDYNDQPTEEVFYFNLTKAELVEMDSTEENGLGDSLKRIIDANDVKSLVAEFKRIILLAYGKKSDDGKRFIKNDELRTEFEQSAAYSALFMELATDDKAAVAFMSGVIPADMTQELDKELKTTTSALPPPPPAA